MSETNQRGVISTDKGSMNIIVRVVTGRIQDADNNSYDKVTIVYVILAGCSVVVSLGLTLISWKSVDLRHLQWSQHYAKTLPQKEGGGHVKGRQVR